MALTRYATLSVAFVLLGGCSATNGPSAPQQISQISDACGAQYGYNNTAFFDCRDRGIKSLPGYIGSGNAAIAQIRGDTSASGCCATKPPSGSSATAVNNASGYTTTWTTK